MTVLKSLPPVLPDEKARLKRLRDYAILDTVPEEAYDRITRLAARILDMPIALISLVDADRQWFKSKLGLATDQTPRDEAFCAHTIAESGVMVVPDAAADPRFVENPLVTGDPHIRFYAGAPLRSPDNHNLGTLCVIDHKPRRFSADDCALLRDLAAVVVDEIEFHQLAVKERQAQIILRDAVEALPDGFVVYDAEDHLVMCNEKYREFYAESADLIVEGGRFADMIRASVARGQYPQAKGREEAWLAERLRLHYEAQTTVEQELPNGRWLRIVERKMRDGGIVGFRVDVTELKRREIQLQELAEREQHAQTILREAMDALPDGFVLYDKDDRLVMCNEKYREMYSKIADLIAPGVTFEELLRHGLARGQYPEAEGQEDDWVRQRLARHRNPGPALEQMLPDGRWLRIEERKTPDGGLVGFRIDITELKRREFELEELASIDPLTGALNRRRFFELANAELQRTRRHGHALAVMLFDADYFKKINDSLGHDGGDDVLRSLVTCSTRVLRVHDIVCRYGGEEFAVLLPETDFEGARIVAERLRGAIAATTVETGAGTASLTISCGVAMCRTDDQAVEDALSRADNALYQAKKDGRNRVVMAAEQPPEDRAGVTAIKAPFNDSAASRA